MISSEGVFGNVTIGDVLFVTITLLLSVIVAKMLTIRVRRSLKDKIERENLEILNKVIYYGVILFAFSLTLPRLGINPSSLLLAGGILGIIIGFASKSVVGNFISGMFLILERPMRIGDSISIDDVSGIVEDVRILSTVVRSYDGSCVRIPNEKVFNSVLTNYTSVARRFDYRIGISYSDDAEKARKVILEVLEDHPFVLGDPTPQIFVDSLGDSSVEISIRIWAPSQVWFDVKRELLWKIKKALDENGIEIPFPQLDVKLKD